jgi:hypothetical protein
MIFDAVDAMPKAVAVLDPNVCCTSVRAETLSDETAEALAASFARAV